MQEDSWHKIVNNLNSNSRLNHVYTTESGLVTNVKMHINKIKYFMDIFTSLRVLAGVLPN